MFTGIIEEISKIKRIKRAEGISTLDISTSKIIEGTKVGDSISVNGVCLTVAKIKDKILRFEAMKETLEKTNLKYLKTNDAVNMERSLKSGDRVGGHFIYGHIDGMRKVIGIKNTQSGASIDIAIEKSDQNLLIDKGAIAIDGISLTIGKIFDDRIRIFLIPHTMKNTTLFNKKPGAFVNIEFDIIGKYLYKQKSRPPITEEFLKRTGF